MSFEEEDSAQPRAELASSLGVVIDVAVYTSAFMSIIIIIPYVRQAKLRRQYPDAVLSYLAIV